MGLGRLLEACRVHEKVALERSSKSTKYELEGYHGGPVHEHFSFMKTARLPPECNEVSFGKNLLYMKPIDVEKHSIENNCFGVMVLEVLGCSAAQPLSCSAA